MAGLIYQTCLSHIHKQLSSLYYLTYGISLHFLYSLIALIFHIEFRNIILVLGATCMSCHCISRTFLLEENMCRVGFSAYQHKLTLGFPSRIERLLQQDEVHFAFFNEMSFMVLYQECDVTTLFSSNQRSLRFFVYRPYPVFTQGQGDFSFSELTQRNSLPI